MHKYFYGGLVLIWVFIMTAGGYGDAVTPVRPGVKVYSAGSYYNGETEIACYWTEAVRTDLPGDGIHHSRANSIFVSGGAVYTAGSYRSESIACYWTDTIRTDLFINIYDTTKANSIFISDGSVYVAGSHHDDHDLPCYWTDTIMTDLNVSKNEPGVYRSATTAAASSICVSGGTAYVAGNLNEIACYWVGDSRIDLPSNEKENDWFPSYSDARSIFVSAKKVYTAGFYRDGSKMVSCYWVGKTRIDLPDGGAKNAWANSIYVSDGKVYVAGAYMKESKWVACYWMGKNRTDLPVDEGTAEAFATSIYVRDGNVYTAGTYGNEEKTTACYWVNQTRFDLPGNKGRANSIFVQ